MFSGSLVDTEICKETKCLVSPVILILSYVGQNSEFLPGQSQKVLYSACNCLSALRFLNLPILPHSHHGPK